MWSSIKWGLIPVIAVIMMIPGCPYFPAAYAQETEDAVSAPPGYVVIEGSIYSEENGEILPHVTVQTVTGGMATKSNEDGRYRLRLKRGDYEIKISHVGFYSQKFAVARSDTLVTRDIYLKSSILDMGERKVYARAYDPAQRVIAEAIRRKKDILSQIHDYSFDAYTRLILADADKPDSENIFLITESRSTSYWEQPDKYKEVITARRQSANIPADANLVAVGQMLNFNRNRIDLGRYNVVSPTATDAMDHYNYYLLDTTYIDSRPVFVLEVEPKNEYSPLFAGTIQIVDSTFDVVGVDVGFSKGINLPMLDSLRYYQSMAQIDSRYWLPIEIGISGKASFDVPMPILPRRIDFSHTASISEYRIDSGLTPGTFGEYELEVDTKADDIDSALWAAYRAIPLTETEVRGYERIDSLEHAPKPLYKTALMGLGMGIALVTVGQPDLLHFNRVEGPYVGYGFSPYNPIPGTLLSLTSGYSFDNKLWQYSGRLGCRLSERRKLWANLYIFDQITHRPTVISDRLYNSTANALLFKIDPFDYYREKGVVIRLSVKPANYTRLKIGYDDVRQLSQSKNTDYGVFRPGIVPRDNPPITEGRMRSVKAVFQYDSRKLISLKGWDEYAFAARYLKIEAGIEYTSPHFIDNDFDFRRYYIKLDSKVMIGSLGITRLLGYAGSSDGQLPPQRYFIVDAHDPDFFKITGFNTVKENNFEGDRAAALYIIHDFGTNFFRNTGDRYLKQLPFGLTVHGGAMWTEFRRPMIAQGFIPKTAPTPYTEIGFGLDNLTPFLMPFNLAINFTWQLSNYPTEKFTVRFDLRL